MFINSAVFDQRKTFESVGGCNVAGETAGAGVFRRVDSLAERHEILPRRAAERRGEEKARRAEFAGHRGRGAVISDAVGNQIGEGEAFSIGDSVAVRAFETSGGVEVFDAGENDADRVFLAGSVGGEEEAGIADVAGAVGVENGAVGYERSIAALFGEFDGSCVVFCHKRRVGVQRIVSRDLTRHVFQKQIRVVKVSRGANIAFD